MFGRSWLIAFIVWCDLWQWKAQSPGLSATNSMSRVAPTGTLRRHLAKAGARRDGAAVGAGHLEAMPVEVDRVAVHAQVAEAHAHALALLDDERVGARPRAAVEREDVEVGHHRGVRARRARRDRPLVRA